MNFKATVRVSRKSLSARIASPGSLAPDVMGHRPPPQQAPSPSYRKEQATRGMLGLTIHSSRRRFAARLNSGVRSAMKVFRCSTYKLRGSQPPAELTQLCLANGCRLVVSSDLAHISIDYFRAAILPHLLLSGAFQGASGLEDAEDLDKRAAAHRNKILSDEVSACYLTVFSETEESDQIAEPNRRLGPYLIAVLNRTTPTTALTLHKNAVNSAISAFAVSARNIDRAEMVFEATFRMHSDFGCVHYCTISAFGNARVIAQLPTSFKEDFRLIGERLAQDQDLASVFRLLASSYTQHSDKLAAFLAAWSAFEIFVGKCFPSQEAKFFATLKSTHADFVTRLREVMKDKYRLADKFGLLASTISADTAQEDIKSFKKFKKVRDELLHGADIDTKHLPLEQVQYLLRRYLLLYINAAQT